ncbi:MAG: metallophosphoesterase [Promethearchaeota archaeon]
MRKINNIPSIFEDLLLNPNSEILDTISKTKLFQILDLAILTLKKIPSLEVLGDHFKNTIIVGDIHGDISVLGKIIKNFLEEKIKSIIFLGDYVDRGSHSLTILLSVYALKLAFPDRICLLKGNHEDINMNKKYGFYDEIIAKFDLKIMEKIDESYNYISLMAITPARSFCVHGGLPRNIISIEELRKITKPYFELGLIKSNQQKIKQDLITSKKKKDSNHDEKKIDLFSLSRPPGSENKLLYNAYYQMLWNDPFEDISGFLNSKRGNNMFKFGEDVVNQFLSVNQLKRIIRSHESSRGPFQQVFKGLIHIFSSGPYKKPSEKALLVHEKEDRTDIVDLDLNVVFKNI